MIRERELPLAASSTTLWRMKSEVYGWRLAPDLKRARRERVTVSRLLERIAREWLRTQGLIDTGALPFRLLPDR